MNKPKPSKVQTFQEAIGEEKIDCDCAACVGFLMHEALRNRDRLDDVSFALNYINKFENFSLVVDNLQTICIHAGYSFEKSFCGFNSLKSTPHFHNQFRPHLYNVYNDFMDNPKVNKPGRRDIKSFIDYMIQEDNEKCWIKSSMFRSVLSKQMATFFYDAISIQHEGLIAFVDKIHETRELEVTDILDALPMEEDQILKTLFMESLMRIWFRKEKYKSIEGSEFAYKSKLSWLLRRVPQWSSTNKGILVIDPVGSDVIDPVGSDKNTV